MQTQTSWSLANPWKVRESAFPQQGDPQRKLKFLLNYATLAPSIYNTQPWTFRLANEAVELLVDPNKTLLSVDPVQRQSILSCGAALQHFQLALRHYGYDGACKIFPDPSHPHLLAQVTLGQCTLPRNTHVDKLFMAIKKRRTYRGPFLSNLPQIGDNIIDAAEKEGAKLLIFKHPDDKEKLADLTIAGESMLSTDSWVRTQREQWTNAKTNEGIPSFAMAPQSPSSAIGDGKLTLDEQRQRLRQSPALLVLFTRRDSPIEWIKSGKALSRVLLELCCSGMAAAFSNQAIEIEGLRKQLARMCGIPNGFPQLLLSVGYPQGHAFESVPRMPVSEKITSLLDIET